MKREKFLRCNCDESLQSDGHSWIKGQEINGSIADLDKKEHTEFHFCAGICQYVNGATFRHCNQNEGNHERGRWTNYSLTDKMKADRAELQRTPAMCVEFSLGWGSIGNLPFLHCTSLVDVTINNVTII